MSSSDIDPNDPTTAIALDQSRIALIELLRQTGVEVLERIADGLLEGQLQLSLNRDGGWDESWTAKLCLPTALGRQQLEEATGQELLECLRSVIHVGDPYISSFRIAHIPNRTSWADRGARSMPAGPIGDRYELLGSLGRGGFAEVFEARDIMTDERIALKILFEQQDGLLQTQALERMRREMRILHETQHPNVIPLLNFGQLEDGRLWYAMPVAGGSLKDRLTSLPRDAASLLAIMEDVAAGVDHLAERNMVHRDVTPANVLYLDGRWVVSDFGMSVDLARESETLTQTGWGVGTMHYAPPERMSAREATPAWDVFSFGQVCLDLVTGIPAPERVGDALPTHPFMPALRRAISPQPEDRLASCTAVVDECRRLHQLDVNDDWESPADRHTRVIGELGDPDSFIDAFVELVDITNADPDLMGNFTSALGRLSSEQIETLAVQRPGGFREVFDRVVERLPTSWTSFDGLDPMGDFVFAAGSLDDDHFATLALRWLTETGAQWNRWHVQGLAEALADHLRRDRLHVIRPALEELDESTWVHALPDMEVLPHEARPRPRSPETTPEATPSPDFGEEPF